MLLRLIFTVSCSDIADFLFISGFFLKNENILTISRGQLPNLITVQIFRVVMMFITNKRNIVVQCSVWILDDGILNTEPSTHLDKFHIPQLIVVSSKN